MNKSLVTEVLNSQVFEFKLHLSFICYFVNIWCRPRLGSKWIKETNTRRLVNKVDIGLIHSSEKNCGKSLTLYLLSKLQGLATMHHPLLLSGGNQSTSGTSAYVSSIFSHIFKAGKRICWERFQPKYKCTLFLLSSGINNCLLKAIFECHLPNTIQTLLVGPLKHAIKKKMASRVRIIHEYKNVDDWCAEAPVSMCWVPFSGCPSFVFTCLTIKRECACFIVDTHPFSQFPLMLNLGLHKKLAKFIEENGQTSSSSLYLGWAFKVGKYMLTGNFMERMTWKQK